MSCDQTCAPYAGCPQLLTEVGQQVITSYKQMGLEPKAVGEVAYRLAIDPTPPLRNIVATDDQMASLLPLWCRFVVCQALIQDLFTGCCFTRWNAGTWPALRVEVGAWQLRKVIIGTGDRRL